MNEGTSMHRRSDRLRIALPVLLIFLTMAANTAIIPVLKETVKDRIGETAIGWFLSLSYLGSFLFAPFAGWISDRSGERRRWIVVAAMLSAFCYFWMSLFPDPMIFLLVRFVEGVVGSFVLSLLLASVSDIEAEQSRPWMMGLAGAMLALGAGLGMPLGAGGRVDPAIPFLISASLMTVIAFLGISLRDADHLIESSHTTIREFLNLMRLERLLVIPLSFVFIDRFTAGFITASLNLHLRETLGLDPGQAGSMLGLVFWPMGLLSLPVSVLMSRTGAVFLMLVGSVIYGLALALLGWTLNVLEVTSLLAITGIGAALMFVPTLSLVSQWAPRNYRGVAIGSYMGIGSLGFLLGPLASVYMKALLANRLESSQVFPALATIFGSLELLMVVAVFPLIGWIRQREKR